MIYVSHLLRRCGLLGVWSKYVLGPYHTVGVKFLELDGGSWVCKYRGMN